MADVSSFDSNKPAGSDSINQGDDQLRTHFSDIHIAWSEEHYFRDGSTNSGGVHKPGSSRISYGTGPAITTGDEGRLFYDVDDNILVAQGSSATTAIGRGTFVGAKAFRNGALNLSDGARTAIQWDSEEYDEGDLISTTTSHFVVPADRGGIYQFETHVHFDADPQLSNASHVELTVEEETTSTIYSVKTVFGSDLANAHDIAISGSADLSVNSVLKAAIFHNTGGNLGIDTGRISFMAVEKVD